MDYNVFNDCPSSMLVSLIDFGERSTSAHNGHLRSCVLGTVADLIGNKCCCRAQTSIRASYLQHPCDVTCLVYTALLNIARFRAKRLASVRCGCSSGHSLAVTSDYSFNVLVSILKKLTFRSQMASSIAASSIAITDCFGVAARFHIGADFPNESQT